MLTNLRRESEHDPIASTSITVHVQKDNIGGKRQMNDDGQCTDDINKIMSLIKPALDELCLKEQENRRVHYSNTGQCTVRLFELTYINSD